MKEVTLPLKELEAIAATRFAFGIGVALLIGHVVPQKHRRWVGWALAVIGALSTPPFIYDIYSRRTRD